MQEDTKVQEEILPEQSKEVEASVDHTELLRDLAACDMAAVLIDGSAVVLGKMMTGISEANGSTQQVVWGN